MSIETRAPEKRFERAEGDRLQRGTYRTLDTIFLFIGSFIIAQSMVVHGLHRRLAFRVLSLRAVGGSTFRIILPSA